ncbi:MAG TPA: AraC family transcriptional regulator [Bacteroidales bacterium]|nr:AraC family transcriptional regulator [Bacteroidales bacterium]
MHPPFHIFELTAELARRIVESPSGPHRHDYEELLFLTEGNPCHYIDFRREQLIPPVVTYVAMGKVHQFNPDLGSRGWAMRYAPEWMPESSFRFYSHFLDPINTEIQSEICLAALETLCRMMVTESGAAEPNYAMIRHLLAAFIAKVEEAGKKQYAGDREPSSPDLITLNNFLKILDENFRRDGGVEFYAEKMNMSARSLNNLCKSILEKSVSEIIESRKLLEARQLLLHSHKTVAEIGFELGYNEKSYFTRVFHKKTGLTPTAFKEKMQALLA